jgi:phage/plasmid-like protein (TIGR03299 family)
MADNINYNKASGQYSFIAKKEPGWHKLGQVLQGNIDTKEALIGAHLDYPVESGLAYCKYNEPFEKDGKLVRGALVKNTRFTYRSDNGIILMNSGRAVTDAYTIVQNVDAFDFFDEMIGKGHASYETAGALGSGETIFITAKLPEKMVIQKDLIDKYLLLTNTHDGSGSITVLFTNIRVVCNNTLNMALQGAKNAYRFKHSKNVNTKVNDLAIMLREQHLYSTVMQEILNELANKAVGQSEVVHYVHSLILNPAELQLSIKNQYNIRRIEEISTNKKNTINAMNVAIDIAPGQDTNRGTAYWLYNGVTSYLTNVREYKTPEDRFKHLVLDGSKSSLQQRAFNEALVLIN